MDRGLLQVAGALCRGRFVLRDSAGGLGGRPFDASPAVQRCGGRGGGRDRALPFAAGRGGAAMGRACPALAAALDGLSMADCILRRSAGRCRHPLGETLEFVAIGHGTFSCIRPATRSFLQKLLRSSMTANLGLTPRMSSQLCNV